MNKGIYIYRNNPIPEYKKKDDIGYDSSYEVLNADISTHKKMLKLDEMGYDSNEIFELLKSKNLVSKTFTPSHVSAFLKKKKQNKK